MGIWRNYQSQDLDLISTHGHHNRDRLALECSLSLTLPPPPPQRSHSPLTSLQRSAQTSKEQSLFHNQKLPDKCSALSSAQRHSGPPPTPGLEMAVSSYGQQVSTADLPSLGDARARTPEEVKRGWCSHTAHCQGSSTAFSWGPGQAGCLPSLPLKFTLT